MSFTIRLRVPAFTALAILLGAATLVGGPVRLGAQDAPSCLPPVACDRFGQRISRPVASVVVPSESASAPRDTVSAPRDAASVASDSVSKVNERWGHMVRGAEIGLGTAAVASLALLSQGCTPKGGDMQSLCAGLEIFVTGITLVTGLLGGTIIGGLWPTH